MLDSDGDGRYNGEELGDPDCKWTPGQTTDNTLNITHPGLYLGFSKGKVKETMLVYNSVKLALKL